MMKQQHLYPTLVLVILGIIIFLIIEPFVSGILSAFVVSFFMLPVFRFISRTVPHKVAALLIIFGIIVILFGIMYFVSQELVNQANAYLDEHSIKSVLALFFERLSLSAPPIEGFLTMVSSQLRNTIVNLSFSVITNLPTIAMNVVLTFFLSYYLLLNWDTVSRFVRVALPITNEATRRRIKESVYKILHGLSLIAIIEFIIALIGFYVAGVTLYMFFSLLIAIGAFIPFFGPIAVWVPLALYYFLLGDIYATIIIIITGLILSIVIDGFLVHIIIGRTSGINPALMILGVLGGVPLFGIFGFVIGPVLMVTAIEYFKEYLANANAKGSEQLI